MQMCKRLKRLEHLFPANALVPRDEPLGGVADDSASGRPRGGINPTPDDPNEILEPLQSVSVFFSLVTVMTEYTTNLMILLMNIMMDD